MAIVLPASSGTSWPARLWVLCGVLVCAAVCVLWSFRVESRATRLAKELSVLEAAQQATVSSSAPAASASPARADFVQDLPAVPRTQAFLEALGKIAVQHKTSLASMSIAQRTPSPDTLGQLTVATTLEGSYPALRQAIAEAALWDGSVRLASVHIRKRAGSADLEARADWLVLSRPAGAPGQ